MTSVLFVCTGNTCRSPLAEAIARREAERRGFELRVASAGTFAVGGAPASAGAVEAARRRGADLTSHRSRPLDPKAIQEADLLIAIGPAHLRILLNQPGRAEKAHLLTDFLPDGHPQRGAGVADPFGGGTEEYERAARTIEVCVEHLLDELQDS